MGRLDGKVALITGAGSGIGHESATLFAQEGARIVCVDLNEQSAVTTADMIADAGGEAIAVRADVSSSKDSETMVQAAVDTYGGLHVMFNNAGIMHSDDGDSQATSEDVWDLTMNVNAKGVFLGCKFGIPAIKRSGGGSIINTASFVAHLGAATPQVAYTASKGAVLALSRELAVVHAREGVRVNALSPGPLRTELLMKFLDTEEFSAQWSGTQRVDSHTLSGMNHRQFAGQSQHSSLRCRVRDLGCCRAEVCNERCRVDDRTAS